MREGAACDSWPERLKGPTPWAADHQRWLNAPVGCGAACGEASHRDAPVDGEGHPLTAAGAGDGRLESLSHRLADEHGGDVAVRRT